MAFVVNRSWVCLNPLASGEDGNRNCNTEKCLSHGRMRGRDRWGQEVQDCDSAENALHNDRGQRGKTENLHPVATVCEEGPKCDDNRKNSRGAGNHAVAVLV